MNVSQWLKLANQTLSESDSPTLDAELLLCDVLNCNRARLYTWPDEPLSDQQLTQLNQVLRRRENGEPVAYILGQKEFYSLELDVNCDVLVPRPDTELIVELAHRLVLDNNISGTLLDAGTGSGAIALALAKEMNSLHIVASDISQAALQVAAGNGIKHQTNNVSFIRSNWFDAFRENSFAMIISNPPYLANDDPHLKNKTLQHEPVNALISGEDGLDDIRRLIKTAPRVGISGCPVLIEHGATQAAAVRALMRNDGYENVATEQDMPGLDRVTHGIIARN